MDDKNVTPSVTEDALFGGRVRIRQPATGYRVNLDTVLLAAAAPAEPGRLVDLGCGVGASLIAVAQRAGGQARFVGVERDAGFAALARENVALSGLAERIEIVEGDALDENCDLGMFDHVLWNPPYDQLSRGRAPADAKQGARVEERLLSDWIGLWCNRMRGGAGLTMIHRADRLGDILGALEGRLGGVVVLPVHPFAQADANRVLVRAIKGSRAPLRLMNALVLHPGADSSEKYTPEAAAIVRGEALIDLA